MRPAQGALPYGRAPEFLQGLLGGKNAWLRISYIKGKNCLESLLGEKSSRPCDHST